MSRTAKIPRKRTYEPAAPEDGERYLLDRLWPRGVKKDALLLTGWLKGVAPTDALRRWFGHDPARWTEFRRRYPEELKSHEGTLKPLRDALKRGTVTLVDSARDEERNHAVALRESLALSPVATQQRKYSPKGIEYEKSNGLQNHSARRHQSHVGTGKLRSPLRP